MADATSGRPSPLPREIVKWLQSLDLSYTVKNPKRDLTNGYLVAEILSRYYTKDVNMLSFENGTRLAAKVDNWEQLFKFFKQKGLSVSKQEIDPVIHCAPGAATALLFHLYNLLTKRTVKLCSPPPGVSPPEPLPAFMRDTASYRLKDPEIDRIQDNIERIVRAADTLGLYHEERRMVKAMEAPLLIQQHRQMRIANAARDLEENSKEEIQESHQVDEVRVKTMAGGAAAGLRGKAERGQDQPKAASNRSQLLKAVSMPKTSVGALAGMQQPALFVKPAADIMRPLVLSIIQDSDELTKVIDTKKDIVVSFMEQCRVGVPDSVGRDMNRNAAQRQPPFEQKIREIEATSVKVFETLANRAQLLVDTLTKSPPEFWKVWTTFYPALTDFSETSPIFESAVFFFKRLGDLMRETDAPLTQQLITEVGLPALVKELARSPEKREAICEIVYSYTQEDTLNHLLVLRALKDKIEDDLPVYVSCLSSLISVDAQLSLLDEHLLDLYIYYALLAMQSPQPKVRVAGISILSTITMCSSQQQSILALLPSFGALANDEWWEVQAQLLLLCAHLLQKLSRSDRQDGGFDQDDGQSANSSRGGGGGGGGAVGDQGDDMAAVEEASVQLLSVVSQLFVVSNSKNVLQVGLSALVSLLQDYPMLVPMYVTVLLEQTPLLRQRILRPPEFGEHGVADRADRRLIYVMGNSSRMYEEKCIAKLWPHLDIAKTLVMQLDASPVDHFELEHMEVMLAALPEEFEEMDADEWIGIFEKVNKYIFVALVDNVLHHLSTQIIMRFWTSGIDRIATRSVEISKRTLLQALRLLYSNTHCKNCVDESAVLQFLRGLYDRGENLQNEVQDVIESFRDAYPAEFEGSQLGSVLM